MTVQCDCHRRAAQDLLFSATYLGSQGNTPSDGVGLNETGDGKNGENPCIFD